MSGPSLPAPGRTPPPSRSPGSPDRAVPVLASAARGSAGRAAAAARTLARAGRGTGGAVTVGARALARAGRGTGRGLRRLTYAQGAGESGLGRVIELHLVATFADTLIVTGLATTIFFAVPTGQARGRVATSLLVTMVPFILLAPVIGPLLDRVRRGRRYALATTLVVRAFLAWIMAGAVGGRAHPFSLYPAAFGFLVCQKAYIVTRAAALPRVLPSGTGLVAANSRISLAGVAALGAGGVVGGGTTAWLGASWALRLAFAVFVVGTVLALALPAQIDSDAGEVGARISGGSRPPGDPIIAELARGTRPEHDAGLRGGPDPEGSASRARRNIGPAVVLGLRANTAVRAFTGFLTLFLAFRLRTQPLPGFSQSASVVLVVVLAAVGGGLGNGMGTVLRRIRPETAVVGVLAATAVSGAWAAVAYGPWAVGAVALIAGTAQALGKLCLDALIQREIPERVRTSAFARSETVLQLAWVVGGGVGLALPLSGAWGLGAAATATSVAAALTARAARPSRGARR
ncbi:MAG TPA: MFS transporter [Kineosporiaceae bacterium]